MKFTNRILQMMRVIYYSIKYIPYDVEYFDEAFVTVLEDRVLGKGGFLISNIVNKSSKNIGAANLYINTKEKELKINEVFYLNNSNDEKYYLDVTAMSSILIREQKKYYITQLGSSFPITYKIEKKSGKIYSYDKRYVDLYPTPEASLMK